MPISLNKTQNVTTQQPVLQSSKPEENKSKISQVSTQTKVLVGTGLAALAATGIYIATRGKAKPKIKTSVLSESIKLPSFSADKAEILNAINKSKYATPSAVPDDILKISDIVIGGAFTKEGKNILMHNADGKLLRKYIPTSDGKTLLSVVDYNVSSGKARKIIKYAEGKPINVLEFNDAGSEVKRTVFWDGTDKLKGIVTKGSDGKTLTVKFKENGTDIDYIHNLSSDFGDIGSVKF